ncbi:MAG TPA: phosphotransferase family protein [Chloroflexota bacterium]
MSWVASLAAYARARLRHADEVRVLRAHPMGRGASNATYAVEFEVACEGRRWPWPCVLRLERGEGLLAPYDVERQFRTVCAVRRAGVPAPAVFWLERDPSYLGARFYLMERVEGRSLPTFWFPAQGAEVAAVAETLAQIHAVDWRRSGLAFLAETGDGELDPLEADLAAWRERARRRGVAGHQLLVALGERLRRDQPTDARVSLLHGDANPGNFLLRGGRVVAVLDWELASLGDPRSDLGFYAALQTVFFAPPPVPGVTSLSRAYEEVTGTPLHDLAYYEALGLYKLAVALAGPLGLGAFFATRETIERRLADLFGPRWAA